MAEPVVLLAAEANGLVIGATLRAYQVAGVQWLLQQRALGHGAVLGDEMGLGKTLQSIVVMAYLRMQGSGPFLVVCPKSVARYWVTELARFVPGFDVTELQGTAPERADKWDKFAGYYRDDQPGRRHQVVVTTPEIILRDQGGLTQVHWAMMVVDEAQRLKDTASKLYQVLRELRTDFSVLLTGTPVQNNLKELYALLSFVAPRVFALQRQDAWVVAYDRLTGDPADPVTTQQRTQLRALLKPYLLRRVKTDVAAHLPPKSELLLFAELSVLQRRYYKAILSKNLAVFSDSSKRQLQNVLMQLRKCSNHPYLFDGVEPEPFDMGEHLVQASSKLALLDKLLKFLHKTGHKVLIFSQMTRMLDILQDYLGYRGYAYERLDGSVRGEERYAAVNSFCSDTNNFVFLLSTR